MRWLVLLLSGCVVMRAPRVDERPRWRLTGAPALHAACLDGNALLRKSGKQGVALALQLRSHGDCAVQFTHAWLELGGERVAVKPPDSVALAGHSLIYAWWPVFFDNNAAWNAAHNDGALVIDYAIAGERGSWRLAMVQQ